MRPAKQRREEAFLDEIVETLRSVPKRRLRIVRDVIGVLAEPAAAAKNGMTLKRTARKSLLETPFCGMWKGRTDIRNGRAYARALRRSLESRGDRT